MAILPVHVLAISRLTHVLFTDVTLMIHIHTC